jgi:hypothetical protein
MKNQIRYIKHYKTLLFKNNVNNFIAALKMH